MSNKYNEKQRDSDCRAPVLPSPMQSPTPQNTRFCVNPMRFPLFFERRRGWEEEVFLLTKVNARADERRRAGLRRAYFFGLQYAE